MTRPPGKSSQIGAEKAQGLRPRAIAATQRIATLTYGREYRTDGASYPARAVQAPVIFGRGFFGANPAWAVSHDMPPQAERNEIVSNAARLLRDAKLLVDNERYASAFALSVLALEEIGKVVLVLWGASQPVHKSGKRLSSHLRKQAAISSLLLAQYITKELGDLVSSGPVTAELTERVSRAMCESEAGKFVRLVGVGAVDKTKQIAFYRDDWLESAGLHADQFDASDVTQLFEKCRAAISALGDSKTMHVGRAIWRTGVSVRKGPDPCIARVSGQSL